MKIIAGSRSSGKTTRLIEEAHNNNGVIICRNKKYREIMLERAYDMGCKIQATTINNLRGFSPDTKFYIDEYQLFAKLPICWDDLNCLNIEAVTMTSDEVVDLNNDSNDINSDITVNVNDNSASKSLNRLL